MLAVGDADGALRALRDVDRDGWSNAEHAAAALMFVEAGDESAAREIVAALNDVQLAGRLAATLDLTDGDGGVEGDHEDDDDEPPDARPVAAAVRDEAVATFLRFFGGRRDLYARQWHDERRGRTGYHPVEQPLTDAVANAHLAGRSTIGQYLLHPDATCSFGVIDLDLSASALAELRASLGDAASPLSHALLHAFGGRLLEAGRRLGVSLFAEDSGSRGLHIWCFFEPRRPASVVRTVLSQVATAAGPPPPDVTIELFPKQSQLGPRGLSSLVKLPLGLHQSTMRRCVLLDDALQPIDDPIVALRRLAFADAAIVEAIAGRRLVPLPAPELDGPPGALPPLPVALTPRSLGELLRGIAAGADEKQACERVLLGCGLLSSLVAKALRERRLEPAEARGIVYTIGLLGPKAALAEEVLASAGASARELERARRGLPSPSGCSRLRQLAPTQCVGCQGPGELPYPTPMLFATGDVPPSPPRHAPFAEWLDGDGPTVQTPNEALFELVRSIDARLARLEREPT